MNALSLWQPWASLVAVGAKHVETRHWPAPRSAVGQPLAIHAAKTRDHIRVCDQEPFFRHVDKDNLPLGAIVAVARLARCAPITIESADELADHNPTEHAFGNYEAGRYAWILEDVRPLVPVVPWRGAQGIFRVPAEEIGLTEPQGALL